MKILTKEEEDAHYRATLQGGVIGGLSGLTLGALGVWGASRRLPAFRSLTLPLKAFLVTSAGTFASIVSADRYSMHFEKSRHPEEQYRDEQQTLQEQANAQKSTVDKTTQWLSDNRYSLVFGSWVASMGVSLGLVGRNPYLTAQQKLVQARVYAQGLTLAVIIVSLAFETSDSARGKGRWETVKILDPNDPTHQHLIERKIHHERYAGEDQWMDMVEAEEQRMKEKDQAIKKHNGHEHKSQKSESSGKGKRQEESKPDAKSKESKS